MSSTRQNKGSEWVEDTEMVTRQPSLTLRGHVEADVAALFAEQLAELTEGDKPVALDFSSARIGEERATEILTEAIRQTAERLGSIQVVGAPTALRTALRALPADRIKIKT
ncbi:MAG: STAS domain-containing protein [Myxococcota bacterium]